MFPLNELADPGHVAAFLVPMKTLSRGDLLQDWEMGGVALNDPSLGLEYQLWHFELEVDEGTGASDVYVSAPGVPKTLLFTGSYVSEIAGCFDQNMNPMVAYIASGTPKIWWFDPTAVAMVHTSLPAGSIDLRCSLDDKRRFNVADSDIVLAYVRGGALYFRYQRERYLTEHLLFDTGSVERLVCIGMNALNCFQWRLRGQSDSTEAVSIAEPILGDIIFDLCVRSGIPPQNIDTSELYDLATDIVPGMKVAIEEGLDKPIDWLREMYQFDKSESNKKIRFPKRGRPVVARIPYRHLVKNTPATLKRTERDKDKLPRLVNINHIDSTGGFAKNKQTASRRTNLTTSQQEKTINTQVVQTPDQAAAAALRRLKIYHNELADYEFSTTIRYTELVVSDVIEVEDAKGTWHRVRLMERNEDSGVIDWTAEQDAGDLAYVLHDFKGNVLPTPISTTPGLVGDTELDIFNGPVQRDENDELGLYVAGRGTGKGWTGYALMVSIDGGTSYAEVFTSAASANIGETATAMTESSTAVEVIVPIPLSSVSPAQIAAGYNRAVIGDEEVQYQTATLLGMVGDKYHYNLTDITRGTLRTLYESWASGIRFIELDEAVVFVQIQREYYGLDLWYKAVSIGQSVDEVTPLAFLFDFAFSQTEWAVSDVSVVANPGGSGVVTTWTPAPRLGTFGPAPYESKYFRGYRLKYSDGKTFDVPPGTFTHTHAAATGGVTVRIFSLNDITGENAWAAGSGGIGGTGGETGGSGGGSIGDPDELFDHGGTLSGAYAGVPYPYTPGDSFYLAGGFWDGHAYGELCPGVCTSGGVPLTQGFTASGWPLAAGTYTANIQQTATSPTPGGSGSVHLAETFTVYAYPTWSLIDLQWSTRYTRNTVVTTPPLTTFDYITAGSDFSLPYTTGKRWGELVLGAASNNCWIGIHNQKGELTPTDYAVAVGYGSPCVFSATPGKRYRIEHDADTGDWEIFEDNVSVLTGNLPLPSGKLYRMAFTNDYVQPIQVKYNFGGETPVDTPTVGFVGIPMPSVKRPVVFRAATPVTATEYSGALWNGPKHGYQAAAGVPHISYGHVSKNAGKWRVKLVGGRCGFAKAGMTYTSGSDPKLGDTGAAVDSIGFAVSTVPGDPDLFWNFGGTASSAVIPWEIYWDANPIFAIDLTAHTLRICAVDSRDNSVVTVHTLTGLPSGDWFPAITGEAVSESIEANCVGPADYLEWTISYP